MSIYLQISVYFIFDETLVSKAKKFRKALGYTHWSLMSNLHKYNKQLSIIATACSVCYNVQDLTFKQEV